MGGARVHPTLPILAGLLGTKQFPTLSSEESCCIDKHCKKHVNQQLPIHGNVFSYLEIKVILS